jgi:hypothetical protein|tara:strand:- start:188 stop:724 length:537 start_codon:yes stop_codon:yes gene_type:complete
MQDVPSDIVNYISSYLTDTEAMKFSTTTKNDWNIPRNQIYRKFIYKKIMPLLVFGEDNIFWIEDMDDYNDFKQGFDPLGAAAILHHEEMCAIKTDFNYFINMFADALLETYNYPICNLNTIGFPKSYYYRDIFANSDNMEEQPEIYYNEKVSMLYRCLVKSTKFRRIKNSLTLRALVG